MTKKINEEHIRVAAYYMWEQAGRPDGRDQEFWNKACDQLFHFKSHSTVKKSCKSASVKVVAKKVTKKVVKKAATKKADSLLKPVCVPKVSAKSYTLKSDKVSVKPAIAVKPFYGIKK